MKLEEFKIGEKFFASAGFEWLCTDKGTRTITAIMLDPYKDESWFIGPPYSLNEEVFDEYDFESCYKDINEMIKESVQELDTSSHPNFLSEDVFKMMKERDKNYPRKAVLKRDRVTESGLILHPYGAKRVADDWFIKTFELFSREYSEMHENDFIKLKHSSEEYLKKRKENFEK